MSQEQKSIPKLTLEEFLDNNKPPFESPEDEIEFNALSYENKKIYAKMLIESKLKTLKENKLFLEKELKTKMEPSPAAKAILKACNSNDILSTISGLGLEIRFLKADYRDLGLKDVILPNELRQR